MKYNNTDVSCFSEFQDFCYDSLIVIKEALGVSDVFQKSNRGRNQSARQEARVDNPYLGKVPMTTKEEVHILENKMINVHYCTKYVSFFHLVVA